MMQNLTLPEALYIISNCVLGYQAMKYEMNQNKSINLHSSISLENVGLNSQGQCRVGIQLWNSSRLNEASYDLKQKSTIIQIVTMILPLTTGQVYCEISTLLQKIENIPHISYNLIQVLIEQFARENNVSIPKKI